MSLQDSYNSTLTPSFSQGISLSQCEINQRVTNTGSPSTSMLQTASSPSSPSAPSIFFKALVASNSARCPTAPLWSPLVPLFDAVKTTFVKVLFSTKRFHQSKRGCKQVLESRPLTLVWACLWRTGLLTGNLAFTSPLLSQQLDRTACCLLNYLLVRCSRCAVEKTDFVWQI